MFKGKYDTTTSHRMMIQDEYRTFSYAEAIGQCVELGDTVIDFGSGSGLLAIMAARAGATKVIAIERNKKTAKWLEKNIEKNRLENVIEIFQGDAADFIKQYADTLEVNVVISECIGDHLFENKMIKEFLQLCDYYQVEKRIPYEFSVGVYPSLIKTRDNFFYHSADKLRNMDIELDWQTEIIDEELLDVAYFSNYRDNQDPYFCLQKIHRDPLQNIIFKFSNLNDIKKYEAYTPGTIENSIDIPQGNGYILIYFFTRLFNDIYFTNHPGRTSDACHSYYQRLIKKTGNFGTLNIDIDFDQRNNEDTPCKNIWIKYD